MEFVYPKNILFEFYDRVSKPQDTDILGDWEVWIYGTDREAFPPHCHIRLKDDSFEFEVSLLIWEVINIKNSQSANSWDSIDRGLRKAFFKWLDRPSVTKPDLSNKFFLFTFWDGANPDNPLEGWVSKKDNLDKDLLEYLSPEKCILPEDLINAIFHIVLPLYKEDKEKREKLHKLASYDIIEFVRQVGLPFEFNEHNLTNKNKGLLTTYEKLCYEMTE